MPRSVLIPAGQRRSVLFIFGSSLAETVRFAAVSPDGGPVSGQIDVMRHRILLRADERLPLRAQTAIRKGVFDASFRIWVKPDRDCEIRFQTWHLDMGVLAWVLGVVAATGLVAGLGAIMLGAL